MSSFLPVSAVLGHAAKAILALVLARAEVFGGAAPFGICFVAAIEEPAGWIAALAGAALGYISLGATTGTLMLAAALLVMSAKLLQAHFHVRTSAWSMPLTALAAYLCAVVPYVALRGWVREDAAYFLCGTVLAGVCTYLYGLSRGEEDTAEDAEQRREVRAVAIMTGVLMSLSSVTVLAGISVGRLLAALAVLAAAQAGGSGWGSCCGICAGLAIEYVFRGFGHAVRRVFQEGKDLRHSGICSCGRRRGALGVEFVPAHRGVL